MDDAIRYMNQAWRKAIAHEARELVERRCLRFHNQDKRRSDSMTTGIKDEDALKDAGKGVKNGQNEFEKTRSTWR
jgi:hypothetical protein